MHIEVNFGGGGQKMCELNIRLIWNFFVKLFLLLKFTIHLISNVTHYRLLDFRVTPLAVGRTINLVQDIKPVSSSTLLSTFYTRENNTCFYGKCYYCKVSTKYSICPAPFFFTRKLTIHVPSNCLRLTQAPFHKFVYIYKYN